MNFPLFTDIGSSIDRTANKPSLLFKRPRLGHHETYQAYVGGLLEYGPTDANVILRSLDSSIEDSRIGRWLSNNDELTTIEKLLEDEEIVIVVKCFWYRRFVWRFSSCWNGKGKWTAYNGKEFMN